MGYFYLFLYTSFHSSVKSRLCLLQLLNKLTWQFTLNTSDAEDVQSVLPPAQWAGCSGTLVPLQDSLSLTYELISITRLDCLTLVLAPCHVKVHFSSEFLVIFKIYTAVQSYLEIPQ